jgi:N-dimethylarginine dimethylaminohydrolase
LIEHRRGDFIITKSEIYVDYEYGDLREVIVGVPFMVYPDLDVADWVQEALKVLPESERKKIIERSGKTSIEIGKYDAMEKENQKLIAIFQKHGIKVWRPEVLSRERLVINLGENIVRYCGVAFQYARDPIAVIGDNVIELTLASLNRIADLLAYRQLFMDRVFGSNAKWFAMPKVDYNTMFEGGRYDKNKFPVLEGGDIHVFGKKILVGTSSNATVGSNELGYRWLKSMLEPQGYEVERVPIKEAFQHLDIVLSAVRPGLAIVCRDAFFEGIPSYFDDWTLIDVSKDDAQRMATNGMPIDPTHYIMSYNEHYDGKRVQEELEAEGISVYRIFFGNHNEDGGSIRCSTHPLLRRLSK